MSSLVNIAAIVFILAESVQQQMCYLPDISDIKQYFQVSIPSWAASGANVSGPAYDSGFWSGGEGGKLKGGIE
ncbi:hypothetical protein BX616_009116, partial [Lobosporangium transversale]